MGCKACHSVILSSLCHAFSLNSRQLQKPDIYRLNPYRPNLHLNVCIAWTPRGRKQKLVKFIQKRPQQAGLVYVRTRRDSEKLAAWLAEMGYATASYHAGLSAEERRAVEASWLSGKMPFVVCTCAFGMGINKPDVRKQQPLKIILQSKQQQLDIA